MTRKRKQGHERSYNYIQLIRPEPTTNDQINHQTPCNSGQQDNKTLTGDIPLYLNCASSAGCPGMRTVAAPVGVGWVHCEEILVAECP